MLALFLFTALLWFSHWIDILWSAFLMQQREPSPVGYAASLPVCGSEKWPIIALYSGLGARGQTKPWVLAKALQHLLPWPVTFLGGSLSTLLPLLHQEYWGCVFDNPVLPLPRHFRDMLGKRPLLGDMREMGCQWDNKMKRLECE